MIVREGDGDPVGATSEPLLPPGPVEACPVLPPLLLVEPEFDAEIWQSLPPPAELQTTVPPVPSPLLPTVTGVGVCPSAQATPEPAAIAIHAANATPAARSFSLSMIRPR
jgi:hypothetical protein